MKPFAAAVLLALAVAVGAPAAAQLAPLPGITVQGHAAVRRPADVARFTIIVGNRQNAADGLTGADELVAALKKAGVADAAVSTPLNNMVNAQSFATVVGSIRKPTAASVRALVASVQMNVPPNAVTIQNLNFVLMLDDCGEAEAIAAQAAFDDALRRAQLLAAAAHLSIGPPTAMGEQYAPNGPCPTKPDAGFFANQQFEPFAGSSLDVTILVNENVTFSIR